MHKDRRTQGFRAKHHPKHHAASVGLISSHDADHLLPILMLTCTLLPFYRVDMSQQGAPARSVDMQPLMQQAAMHRLS